MKPPMCPQCSVTLEQGFTVDRSHYSFGHPSKWVSGSPERSFLFGVKTEGRKRFTLAAYRCPQCGRVDFYAPEG
ncbi:MAG TPA: hypothetical protein VFQ05_02795 [Candidatus Eisenbacteria bacterium]|nr:hypothetical protein [Candidatus Eisenbacteria bacterium]